jgi:hypothetical protein
MDNGWTTVPATDLAPPLQQIKLIMIHITCILKSLGLSCSLFSSRHVTIANVTHSQPPRLLFNRLRRTQADPEWRDNAYPILRM